MVYVLPLNHFGKCLLHSDANLYANKSGWCDSDFCEGMWGGEGFSGDSVVKNLLANAGDVGSISVSGRSLGGRNGSSLQYSCLGNPMDRGAWRATVHRFTVKSLQSCLPLCNSINSNPPGSSVHGISQARILEWAATSSSRGSSWPRDQIPVSCISCIGRQVLYLTQQVSLLLLWKCQLGMEVFPGLHVNSYRAINSALQEEPSELHPETCSFPQFLTQTHQMPLQCCHFYLKNDIFKKFLIEV